jgi:oligoribonuclease NrnB/cAMP/cGMP phosphodiesterase (DHH superfamily)
MDLIIYHNNCPDGWCAAYICKTRYPEAAFYSLNHGLGEDQIDALFAVCVNKDVIMVDYSLRTRVLNDQLNDRTKSFRILDHHKSAREVLDGADYATFDMKRSGAGMAWDYLFGKDSPRDYSLPTPDLVGWQHWKERPWWVNYVEDQDLWNWALSDSEVVNAYLMVQERSIATWNEITRMNVAEAKILGLGVREYIEYYTRCVLEFVQGGMFHGYSAGVLNVPYVGVSEAGNAICKSGYPLAVLWFERNDGQMQFSLRGDGSVDVSKIAQVYSGGGHNNAAGFQVSIADGRLIVDHILNRPDTNLILDTLAEGLK